MLKPSKITKKQKKTKHTLNITTKKQKSRSGDLELAGWSGLAGWPTGRLAPPPPPPDCFLLHSTANSKKNNKNAETFQNN